MRSGNKRKNVKFFQELRVIPDILGITRNPWNSQELQVIPEPFSYYVKSLITLISCNIYILY